VLNVFSLEYSDFYALDLKVMCIRMLIYFLRNLLQSFKSGAHRTAVRFASGSFFSPAARVTRGGCEKVARNVANPFFAKINIINIFALEKIVCQKMGHFSHFRKTTQTKQSPNRVALVLPCGYSQAKKGPPKTG
jgi:hypothetical protein